MTVSGKSGPEGSTLPLTAAQLLRARPHFARLWVGHVVSRFGDSVDGLAVMWLVLTMTGSTLLMGTLSAVGMLPSILLGPFAGVLVDRWPRRRVMLVGDAGRGILTMAVAYAWASGRLQIWMLFAWLVASSCLEVFAETARRAVVPSMVGERNLVVAYSLAGTGQSLAELFGYVGAGVVLARFGIAAAILIDSATFWFSAGAVALSRIPELPHRHEKLDATAFFRDLRQGFAFLSGHKVFTHLLFLVALTNGALGPLGVLLPAFVGKVLGVGPESLGYMFASLSVGVLVGSLVVGSVARGAGELRLLRTGLLGIGGALALIWAAGSVWHVAGLMLALGLAIAPAQAGLGSLFQRLTPADKQGRIMALRGSVALAITPLSSALAGALGEAVSIPVLFGVGGLAIAASSAAILWNRTIRTATTLPPVVEQPLAPLPTAPS